jgi:hypothetical protein
MSERANTKSGVFAEPYGKRPTTGPCGPFEPFMDKKLSGLCGIGAATTAKPASDEYLGTFIDTKDIVGDVTLEADGRIAVRITHKEETDYDGGYLTFGNRRELNLFVEKIFVLRLEGKL